MNTKTEFPFSAVRPEEAKPLPPEDAIRIHELLHRVYLAEGTRDRDALEQLVTEDFVQIHTVFGRVEGRQQFASWVINHPELFDGFRHQALNIATREERPGQALAVSYILVLQLFSTDPALQTAIPRIIGHGAVTDLLVKRDERWQLQKRVYDQFSLLAAFLPDSQLRDKAAHSLQAGPG